MAGFLDLVTQLFPSKPKSDNTSITAPDTEDPIKPMHDEIKKGDVYDWFGQVWEVTRVLRRSKKYADGQVYEVDCICRDDFDAFGKCIPHYKSFRAHEVRNHMKKLNGSER